MAGLSRSEKLAAFSGNAVHTFIGMSVSYATII
jgi:hypothetical protein